MVITIDDQQRVSLSRAQTELHSAWWNAKSYCVVIGLTMGHSGLAITQRAQKSQIGHKHRLEA